MFSIFAILKDDVYVPGKTEIPDVLLREMSFHKPGKCCTVIGRMLLVPLLTVLRVS